MADSLASHESFHHHQQHASADTHHGHHGQDRRWEEACVDGVPPFEVLGGLGQGGYATVVLARPCGGSGKCPSKGSDSSTAPTFAMKVVSKLKQRRTKDQKRLATELKVMRDLPPSHFLERCHAAFESATDVFFVCDYIGGGDLFYHMCARMQSGQGGFREQEVKVLLAEVTLGLEHLHAHGFIHRDLKVENIMLDASGHVKIIDFGLAFQIADHDGAGAVQSLSPSGSLIYMAPELLKKHSSGGRHTDWWAMGILAYELMTGRTPWSSLDDHRLIKHEITNCQVLPPISVSPQAAEFVESLLRHDFRGRLGFACDGEVKTASFFAGVDWLEFQRGENAPAFECGQAEIHEEDRASALEAYGAECSSSPSSSSSFKGLHLGEVKLGKHGVRSPWFLGVDVVTSHPALALG